MEGLATSAERDSIKYMVKHARSSRSRVFRCYFWCEWEFCRNIENKCEGMVRIRDIKDDYYTFDEKQYALVGATLNYYN
jgi:ribonuclease R